MLFDHQQSRDAKKNLMNAKYYQQGQEQRQRRQVKSKIYKQMLDNQILINQRYKREQQPQLHHPPPLRKEVKPQSRPLVLPSIKDKNTYYQGSSKFIKVDAAEQEKPKKPQIRTEMAEEQSETDLDEYNETCEKIIRELKSINKESPKMRYRRKLYEYSSLAPNKSKYQPRIEINELKSSEAEVFNSYGRSYSKYDPSNANHSQQKLAVKPSFDPDYRVPSFSLVEQEKTPIIANSFQGMSIKSKKQKTSALGGRQRFLTESNQPIDNQFEVERPPLQLKPKLDSPQLSKSTIKRENTLPLQPKGILKAVNQMQQNLSEPGQNGDPFLSNLRAQKQNFLQLLRKAKNRGQSLYIKLSSFPSKGMQQKN